jgi:MFS family permease
MSDRPDGRGLRQSRWFALAVLTLTFSIGFVDRQMINLLVQPIKTSFGLSDLKISVLQGLAFSLTYLIMSPLFGRWVDLRSRRATIIGCVLVWSFFTATCGFAVGFLSMFVARALVGAAEAGLTPAAWSMMSDRFSGRALGRAMSIYNVAPYVGGGFALVVGGLILKRAANWDLSGIPLLNGMLPWQLTFLIVGAMGILCLILLPFIPEPQRQGEDDGGAKQAMPLGVALETMHRHKRFYYLFYIGMALAIIPIYAFPAWVPAFAMRQFNVPIATVGLEYGIISLVSGTAGVLLSPTIADFLARSGRGDENMRIGVFTSGIVCACGLALFVCPSFTALLWIGGIASFFYSMPSAMAAAALQAVTPSRMRGLVSSLYIVVVTIMGLAIAPTLVAFFTDKVFQDEARVGDSLAIVCSVAAVLSGISLYGSLAGYRRLLNLPIEARIELHAAPAE